MAKFGKAKLPISQHELLREIRADGRRMARSTLNYHLLALEHANVIRRRSYRPKYVSGEVRQRVTAYSIGLRGQEWISLWATSGPKPAARPSGVRNSGHIRSTLKLYGGAGGTAGERFAGITRRRRRTRAPR